MVIKRKVLESVDSRTFFCTYACCQSICATTCKIVQSRPMMKQSGDGRRYPRNDAKTTDHDNAIYPFQGSPMKSRPPFICYTPSPAERRQTPIRSGQKLHAPHPCRDMNLLPFAGTGAPPR